MHDVRGHGAAAEKASPAASVRPPYVERATGPGKKLIELLSHAEMLLEMRERLRRPTLQVRIPGRKPDGAMNLVSGGNWRLGISLLMARLLLAMACPISSL